MTQGDIFRDLSQSHDRLLVDYNQGQAPHALLLTGQSGIWKEEFAATLAASLLCTATENRPCGHCDACHRASSGQHSNLYRLALAGDARSIKIEQLRELLSALALHPLEEGRRVVMIIRVDAMTVQAQNALLKNLEEPESSDFFILTANNERAVLSTIVSRCQFVRLSVWPDDRVEQLLISRGVEKAQARALTQLAAGRPGIAIAAEADRRYGDANTLADATFFAVKKLSDIPAASMALKDARDTADLLLDLIEQRAGLALRASMNSRPSDSCHSEWSEASRSALSKLMEAVFAARKLKASNVSWQAIADQLLFTITKEIHQCQWS